MVRVVVLFALLLLISGPISAFSAEFSDLMEREFSLRSIGQLQVTNLRGGIEIHGWALDRVRVKARRHANAETQEEAKKLFQALDFRFRSINKDIELSAEYGQGLTIEQRLQERAHPRAGMDMIVYAPANLPLRIWAIDSAVSIKGWKAAVEVRTSSGPIRLTDSISPSVSLLCPSCPINVEKNRGSVRCMGGDADVSVQDIQGENIYVETRSGSQKVDRINGEQLYVSGSGGIQARHLLGHVEFHSQKGTVQIDDLSGFASGRTESGDIEVRVREWRFKDRAIIEAGNGSISLFLPYNLAAEVDLWAPTGSVETTFPIHSTASKKDPDSAHRIRGIIGEGGEQLQIRARNGNVRLFKKI